ncbi:sigma-54 dependent transcriptional regulator [Craterilacuibacter sp. RT1T]|uniref:sigma-54-dependent transcriptional regulator n=1 Tax=Craterilacuibacter sp. RT1T TaxID=2942211 RepID=UPI0020BF0EB0|nr:sigma-54 dependent transcriptional regulator [Craterilacuibacter sp. RT1T]MCL6263977.1 sigma-54 dependent transcriptional regulator [Craterilacuibacter sp. RT1T]
MRSSDILIVDDEVGIRELLSEILQDEGYTVAVAENAEVARQLRNQTRPALVLLDIWMPDCDGVTLLKEWGKSGQLNMPVIMMSGHASIDTAVEATRIGAFDFLEKPIALQKLLSTVQRALKYGDMQANTSLNLDKLGKSEPIHELRRQLERVSKIKSPVLLTGEPGAGFELVARFFHHGSAPWVTPGKPEQLADAPLELLQKANNGVLYLSEIGQYNRRIQQGLLFLLSKLDRFNVRLVCSCSRPLQELLVDSECDNRLLTALSSVIIPIPPLREHSEDIMLIAEQLLTEQIESKQVPARKLTTSALNALRQYNWPGNLEQLKGIIKSLALTAETDAIDAPEVNKVLAQFRHDKPVEESGFDFTLPLRELREQLERRYFEHHIALENGNMSRVAQKVGLERTHLYRKLKQLGVRFTRKQLEE